MLFSQAVCKIKSGSAFRSAGVQHQARHYVLLDQDNVKDQVWNLVLLDPVVCKIKSGTKC